MTHIDKENLLSERCTRCIGPPIHGRAKRSSEKSYLIIIVNRKTILIFFIFSMRDQLYAKNQFTLRKYFTRRYNITL